MNLLKVALLVPLLAAGLVGCSRQRLDVEAIHGLSHDPYPKAPDDLAPRLRVLIWPDTVYPDILEGFEKRYGVKVEVANFDNDDEAYQKLTANPGSWDVVLVSQYMGNRMLREGLLQPVPRQNEDFYREIDTSVVNPAGDPQMKFFIPFDHAAIGISFNVDHVAGFPRRWDYLDENAGNPYLYGRMVMTDDMRYAFAIALLYGGRDPSKATEADVRFARDLLIRNVKEFGLRFLPEPRIREEMIAGKALIAITWSGEAAAILKQKSSCRFLVPEGKCIMTVDGFGIPRQSRNAATAALFIEYMLHPYVSMVVANRCMYASANLRTMKHVDRFVVNGPSSFIAPARDQVHMKPLTPGELAIYQAAWKEVKAAQPDAGRVNLLPLQ
jgi:spermidine/putrescine transport system substrate-binding protein